MGVTNYNGLVSAVMEALEDDSQETQNYIPTAIQLAQYRIIRESDNLSLESVAVVTATPGSAFLAKPSNYRVAKQFRAATSEGIFFNVDKQTLTFCEAYWPYAATSVGVPRYYADYLDNNWYLSPTPDANYRFLVHYVRKPVFISAGRQTNDVTEYLPDALFHGTMSEMADFARNTLLKQVHEQSYVNIMVGGNNEDRRSRRDEGLQPLNRNINLNTLKQEN